MMERLRILLTEQIIRQSMILGWQMSKIRERACPGVPWKRLGLGLASEVHSVILSLPLSWTSCSPSLGLLPKGPRVLWSSGLLPLSLGPRWVASKHVTHTPLTSTYVALSQACWDLLPQKMFWETI